jgi:hypothetical protein
MALPAVTIDTTHPRNADTGSERQLQCRAFHHFAHDLMARNELRSKCRQISFHNVQISAANPAGDNPKQDVPGLKLWTGDFRDLKKRSRRFMY